MLILLVGIVLMFLGEAVNLLFGVLTVSFVLVVVTGIVLVLVFLRREANLSELQADFVSKVSHELRTPLTSIRLFVETMARARKATRRRRTSASTALGRETERLTQLIERLLDWGRMEAGRKLFDLRAETRRRHRRRGGRGVRPLRDRHADARASRWTSSPAFPRVDADRDAMVDALGNLLTTR